MTHDFQLHSENPDTVQIQAPNYTQIPNIVFDHWMAILKPAAFKVLICMCRKIFGWHKTNDAISKNQIMKVTGLSKNSVQAAIEELENYSLLRKFRHKNEFGHQPNTFALHIDRPMDKLYQDSNLCGTDQNLGGGRSKFDPGVGQNLIQGVGQNLTPQKKDYTKERLTKEYSSDSQSSSEHPSDFTFSSSGKFEGITEQDLNAWKTAYPEIDIDREIIRAEEWLKSNPSKAKKKLWRKFLIGWFSRANDKAENQKAYRQTRTQSDIELDVTEKNRQWLKNALASVKGKFPSQCRIVDASKGAEIIQGPHVEIIPYSDPNFQKIIHHKVKSWGLLK